MRSDVRLIGFLNPSTNQIEGAEADLARQIALAIFGSESKVELKPVTVAQRTSALMDNSVDLTLAAMTITAERKQQIDFSSPYFVAGQRLLVRRDAGFDSIQAMSGRKVCSTRGSTSALAIPVANPQAVVLEVDNLSDCLAELQNGRADAISTDDTLLAGLASQDKNTKIVGPQFTSEPLGIGVAKNRPELVGFVNGVLEQIKRDGKWASIYTRWFGELLDTPAPPVATFTS